MSAVFSFSEACSEEKSIKVSLNDYWGKSVSSKEYTVKSGDTSLTASFGVLAKGHYTVKAEISGDVMAQEFFAVVTPQNQRIRFSDTPFGVDTAFSIIGPRETIDDNLEALKLSGASWIRERLILSGILKSGGAWDFKGSFSDEVLTKAKNLGLKTHVMIQSMPASLLDSDSKENSELITKDYVGLHDFSKQLAEYYDGCVDTFEIFNEPDTNVGSANSETGDKVANYVKATAIGIKDADTQVGITAPGYSSVRTEPLELGLRCGMLDFVDIGAYHSHQTYNKNYTTQSLKINPTQNFNNLMSAYGYTKKQAWLDEMGISLGSSDSESLSEKEQRSQASYCIMSICEAISKGADKTFSYLFNDKRSRFSWFSRFNEGPNRVYTAFSVMTDVLGEGECLGKVNYFDGVEGYIFKNGHKQILVLRCDTQSSINIPVTAASTEIIKVDGSSSVKYPKGGVISVEVSPDPVFVSISGEYGKALYIPRDEKMNDFKVEEKSFSEADRIIVHQTYPADTRANAKYDGYKVGEKTEVTVTVTNLNSVSKEGIIYGETFSGWEISPKEQSVRIEENQTATLTFWLIKSDDVIDNQKSAVVFKGKFGDEYTKESVTEIVHTGNIEYEQIRSMPELLLASSWRKEACSGTQTTINTEEDGISFKFNFPVSALDKWAYPSYEFSEVQDFSGADGILIRYYAEESFADYDKLTCAVWLGEKDGGRYITSLGKVLNKGENVWLIPFSEFTHRNGNEIDNILTTEILIIFLLV